MECPQIHIINYSEFHKRFYSKFYARRIPLTGTIEVTARCNLHCAHCYINLPVWDHQAKAKELSCQQFFHILDQISDAGCLWLLFTGGESFIRPDFIDIYTYAKKKGFIITLFTNGTTITSDIADYLAEWRPFSIEITLYGRTKETYESVTGVSGSYAKCIRGIELLLEKKLPLKLKSMIMTLNKNELWDIKAYAEELGVDFRFDTILNMRLDGDHSPGNFRITPEEIIALDLADEKRIKDFHAFFDKFRGAPPDPEYLYQCGAGRRTFHIDPYGQLSTCLMVRYPSYEVLKGSFYEGWHDFIPEVLSQKWSQDTPCKTCKLYALCGQCPAYAQMEYDDPGKPVEYLCRVAHLRAEAFKLSEISGGI